MFPGIENLFEQCLKLITMEKHTVKILETENLTYNVKRFMVKKPDAYKFKPGQATEMAVNLPKWKEQKRPYTFPEQLGYTRIYHKNLCRSKSGI